MITGLTAKLEVKEGAANKLVAYISNWSVDIKNELAEITALGKTDRESFPVLSDWTASAEGVAVFGTAGEPVADTYQKKLTEAMRNGTSVNLSFAFDGTYAFAGDALIDKFSIDLSAGDLPKISISVTGCGALAFKTSAVQSNDLPGM